ncbi:GGDEF domain-containing protein [Cognatishimia sp. MH4019]|uniref:GGDEF domain-containing protein n=1 Tax=Cognatishimia sp. MH4019 TaxID=2854030 RepID=UPI001CD3D5FC|nr:GGDEF domain-containing protein [Cognatishimia sp. MH4019]
MTALCDLNRFLDTMMPMHMLVGPTGHISHAGPTLRKLLRDDLVGMRFLEVFDIRRPRCEPSMRGLLSLEGRPLHLQFRNGDQTSFKGVLVAQPANQGLILNLSFGISVIEAVGRFGLTNSDFAPTDLTVEMLYLVEAKSAVMEESRDLNLRLQGAKIAAEEQAFTDTLTGLKNRRAMDHVLDRVLDHQMPFALMHLDLDYFKAVNDTMGHAAGDHVLQVVARALIGATRAGDTIARVGGDEFVLLLHGLTDRTRIEDLATHLIAALEKPIPFNGEECRISASAGTTISADYEDPQAAILMDDADVALYASKRAGRACHTFYASALRDIEDEARKTA